MINLKWNGVITHLEMAIQRRTNSTVEQFCHEMTNDGISRKWISSSNRNKRQDEKRGQVNKVNNVRLYGFVQIEKIRTTDRER